MLSSLNRLLSYGTEVCFYLDTTVALTPEESEKVRWVVAETFESDKTSSTSFLTGNFVEIGPYLGVETPFSSNAVSICHSMGLGKVQRVEYSLRYPATRSNSRETIIAARLDLMTQSVYAQPLGSFSSNATPADVREIPLLKEGEAALKKLNEELGLGMDAWDIAYYTKIFKELGRNPTDVELFQIGNANSEHCRHWFFRGKIVIDGAEMPHSLIDLIRKPLLSLGVNHNSLLAFNDNAGAIKGHQVSCLLPGNPSEASPVHYKPATLNITATAETHNHPTMVEPFQGAATGTGGRIRDNTAAGRGALPVAGFAGYCVGNLFVPGHAIPGEEIGRGQAFSFASPLKILIEGSNGISAYGNQFGEPVIGGFTRSFGLGVGGERREFLKPILYSGGVGRIMEEHLYKQNPETGMLIIRIGGPAYRIGVGGGAASSLSGGANSKELDRKSVQRGNGEMGNKVNRVLRACVEMASDNPILSLHDQGAGGPSNVLTELMAPVGGRVDIRKINLGDKTMSVLEIWSAEFQEGYGLLLHKKDLLKFQKICRRERVNCEVMGEITGDGKVTVIDSAKNTTPVELSLDSILGNLPRKTFEFQRPQRTFGPLDVPEDLAVEDALQKVFLLPQVGSKGFLVHKVDRSVTGLIARQQCCGPAQIPVSDVSVTADSYMGLTGAATSLGEQPSKILLDSRAGTRMALGEMLTNMASAGITSLDDIKCRVNWMWAAKLAGEGALLYDAAAALSSAMVELGIAADGGKDSSSMSVKVSGEMVKSPGEVVIFGYAPMPDITKVATPDFKHPGRGMIGYVDLGLGKNRMGGSSFAQAFGQVGDKVPDMDPALLKRAFNALQELNKSGLIHALHDRSDGGLIACLSEMCMSGLVGAKIDIGRADSLQALFSEELGFIFEYLPEDANRVMKILTDYNVPFAPLGTVSKGRNLVIKSGGKTVFKKDIAKLRQWWEATSARLEELQGNPLTAREARKSFLDVTAPAYQLSFSPAPTPPIIKDATDKPKVAVIREEGTNGDREMKAALTEAGFEAWDVNMGDMLDGMALEEFRGVVFPGGFSYMDVFDSAKGWAAVIRFNDKVRKAFDDFFARSDTFSLGVCNGCQLMALLSRVPFEATPMEEQPRFVHNKSKKFESRWTQVRITDDNPSLMLKGMGGSVMGVWVAHGEGRLVFPSKTLEAAVRRQGLVPLEYVDPQGRPTGQYPYNPNGSNRGGAGLCSANGRHLAMMPHPERCFQKWQWPWMPKGWEGMKASPWLKMFQNAREWCQWAPAKELSMTADLLKGRQHRTRGTPVPGFK